MSEKDYSQYFDSAQRARELKLKFEQKRKRVERIIEKLSQLLAELKAKQPSDAEEKQELEQNIIQAESLYESNKMELEDLVQSENTLQIDIEQNDQAAKDTEEFLRKFEGPKQ